MNDRPHYCQDCGLSLIKPETWCTSRPCTECGKEVFFVRRGDDGGIKVEKGDKFHIPEITLSLDPNDNIQFTRIGLMGFLKKMFLGTRVSSQDELVKHFQDTENSIDAELKGIDCISHCDLETTEGVKEALGILHSHGLLEQEYNLFRSGLLRECCNAIKNGDSLRAAYTAHHANIFKELSLLEYLHLQEILWLGYQCYQDISKNEGETEQAAKEKILLKGVVRKLRGLDSEFLYALNHDDGEIAPRISVTGISERTIKSLIEHELQRRKQEHDDSAAGDELKIKKAANRITLALGIFTLINAIFLAIYKDWIG